MRLLSSRLRPQTAKPCTKAVRQVRDAAARLENLETDDLQTLTKDARSNPVSHHLGRRFLSTDLNAQVLPFALITEAVRRTTGKTFYDVQLAAGIELATGRVVQMQTGEGKTLTTALPAFVRSLGGRVHIATTNAYLARRDCEELRPAFELLGLSVGLLPEEHDEQEKRDAYRCDITFGTGYDFGFDFLRDQLAIRQPSEQRLGSEFLLDVAGRRPAEYKPLQPGHVFAIVDEADSVLIDEATMPLILSTPKPAGGMATPVAFAVFELANQVALTIIDADDYQLSGPEKTLTIEESAWQMAYDSLQDDPSLALARPWSIYVENAIRAHLMFERDVDYVVVDDTIQIVDQHTGRIHDERTWRDGLHQAVEVKEQITVTPESGSDARITRQRYFQCYDGMAGMTGTATGVEREMKDFYGLSVSVIPTHRPNQREVLPLRCFVDDECRNTAIARDVFQRHDSMQPILVGTRTIRHSHELSRCLNEMKIAHTVLNGLQDETEASVVSKAGGLRSVTIATNMAGRGTDISLSNEVKKLGGLHVIGAEMNLSGRVDRQLAGRAARQGDRGSCQFFISADDELVAQDDDLRTRMLASTNDDGECCERFESAVEQLQATIEQRGFESRRAMVSRDRWLDGILQTLAGRGRIDER